MILWTIQHQEAYQEMLKNGVLRGNHKYITADFFEEPYAWMANQMKKRVGTPPDGVSVPVWAWYQWEGKRKRPDMRVHGRGQGYKGTPIVLLTLDVPDDKVLLSDFDYWHYVLNDWEIIFPIADDIIYTDEEKRKSWENIFDICCSFSGEENRFPSTQATMWEIKKEWVIKAEHFVSR